MKTKSTNVCINLNAIEEFIYFRGEGGGGGGGGGVIII